LIDRSWGSNFFIRRSYPFARFFSNADDNSVKRQDAPS
jgi:hypothetical protein